MPRLRRATAVRTVRRTLSHSLGQRRGGLVLEWIAGQRLQAPKEELGDAEAGAYRRRLVVLSVDRPKPGTVGFFVFAHTHVPASAIPARWELELGGSVSPGRAGSRAGHEIRGVYLMRYQTMRRLQTATDDDIRRICGELPATPFLDMQLNATIAGIERDRHNAAVRELSRMPASHPAAINARLDRVRHAFFGDPRALRRPFSFSRCPANPAGRTKCACPGAGNTR